MRRVVLGLMLAVSLCGCAGQDTAVEQPRLVLLYATCTVNKSYLSPYADGVTWTPKLEAFAADSVVFQRHRSEAGMSGIAYASIFTGAGSEQHRIFTHPRELAPELVDITEVFAAAGYETWFWHSHSMANWELGYGQAVTPERQRDRMLLADDEEFEQLLGRLAADPDARALVITNFSVTHAGYRLKRLAPFCKAHPEVCRPLQQELGPKFYQYATFYEQIDRAKPLRYDPRGVLEEAGLPAEEVEDFTRVVSLIYTANVWLLDALFGELVAKIDTAGLRDDSMIVFTADHGETLYAEDAVFWFSHSHTLRSDVLDVPLLIRHPRGWEPGSFEPVSHHQDLLPTLAAAAGVALPAGTQVVGEALQPGREVARPRVAWSHTGVVPYDKLLYHVGRLRAELYPSQDIELTWVGMREGDRTWKLERTLDGEFVYRGFDLASDPRETRDLFDPGNQEHLEKARQLTDYKRRLVAVAREGAESGTQELSEDQLEALRSLGYLQ